MERNIEKYAENYLEAPFLLENVRYRRKCVLEQLRKYPHKRILEVGCGLYPLFQYIDEDVEYYIIEPSKVFADNAITLASNLGKEITVINDYFEDSIDSVEDIRFDFIICSSLLHEVEDEKKFLISLYEIMGKDTIAHINVPNAMSVHRLLAKEMGLIFDIHEMSETNHMLQQRIVYDMKSLSMILEEANFSVLDIASYFIKPFTHKQMQMMVDAQILDDEILRGLDALVKYFPNNGSEIYANIRRKDE